MTRRSGSLEEALKRAVGFLRVWRCEDGVRVPLWPQTRNGVPYELRTGCDDEKVVRQSLP
jgi:hypothetical protein